MIRHGNQSRKQSYEYAYEIQAGINQLQLPDLPFTQIAPLLPFIFPFLQFCSGLYEFVTGMEMNSSIVGADPCVRPITYRKSMYCECIRADTRVRPYGELIHSHPEQKQMKRRRV